MSVRIDIYTDGACKGNPGPGGWGAVLRYRGHEKRISGAVPHTTNNQMELTGAIEGLAALTKPARVTIYTDSSYVRNGITTWVAGWQRNGWRTAGKKPVKNVELWQRLDAALKPHEVRWHWIKGHTTDAQTALNDRADELAVAAAARASR